MAFSSDGHLLATTSIDGTARLWEVTNPAQPRKFDHPLAGNLGPTASVAFSPDSPTLAIGRIDGTVLLWDDPDSLAPSRQLRPDRDSPVDHTGPALSVAFSHDGNTLAAAHGDGLPTAFREVNTVTLWDLTDPNRPHQRGPSFTSYTGPAEPHTPGGHALVFSPNGSGLATGNHDGSVVLWDIADPAHPQHLGMLPDRHARPVSSLAFSPDGHTVATTDNGNTVFLWDLTDPRHPQRRGKPLTAKAEHIGPIAYSSNGHTLASGTASGAVILWELPNLVQPHQIGRSFTPQSDSVVFGMAVSPDGTLLATSTVNSDSESTFDPVVTLWNLTDQDNPQRFSQPLHHPMLVLSAAFSPNPRKRLLATGRYDGPVMLGDLTDPDRPQPLGNPLTAHSHSVYSIAFSPDGNTLATTSIDDTVILWDLTDPTHPKQLAKPLSHPSSLLSVAFSPDGHTLATGTWADDHDDSAVVLWDLTDRTHPRQLGTPRTDHDGSVRSVNFAADGDKLVTTSDDGVVIVWDIADPAHPHRLSDIRTGQLRSAAFHPDQRILALGGVDGRVTLWTLTDPAHPRPLGQSLTRHTGQVVWTLFSADGHTLITSAADRTVVRWDLKNLANLRDHAVERACTITGGGLTSDEWAMHIPKLPHQDTCSRT